ncbi:MAG: site-2 protease family protein [Calditrichaeota bacterium]|nr:MAG: site-2 protease family protein [Calditrichota bacterium]MBL1205304.1 site-2 protease family protein [Calditrichota bacterium]NOG45133.1 site-2 protease family protein [Calditrichota bacterium]
MYSKRRAEIAEPVIRGRLKLDKWARMYGFLVYKQDINKLTDDEIRGIQEELLSKGLYSQAEFSKKKYYLRILSSDHKPGKNQVFVPILLLFVTILTTTITGVQLGEKDPFSSWENFSYGFNYSFALLSILFCHEMGHYLFARFYGLNVTLPYFLPIYFPFIVNFGTLGAFIRLKEQIPNKKALFDIGVAGPIAGFVVSLIFLIIGFHQIPNEEAMWEFIGSLHPIATDTTGALTFGSNILFDFIAEKTGRSYLPMSEVYHFPYIVAGWFGLLITALNLMPIGQLDGGHITHAMFGGKSARIAVAGFAALIALNIVLISQYNSWVYFLWPFLIILFIKFKHPPTLDESINIGVGRKLIGYISYIVFIICFSPMPIYFQ